MSVKYHSVGKTTPSGAHCLNVMDHPAGLGKLPRMVTETIRHRKFPAPGHDGLFLQLPEAYYHYALEWCAYPHWTLAEAANLMTGCVPHRPMFLKGDAHKQLDLQVLENENRIRSAIKGPDQRLDLVKSRKYFGKAYLLSEQVFTWIEKENIDVPGELIKAEQVVHHRFNSDQYTTPCLEAARWVVENFWEHANLREPPTQGAIIQALLQQFPALSGQECDWVERVTRHPLARPD